MAHFRNIDPLRRLRECYRVDCLSTCRLVAMPSAVGVFIWNLPSQPRKHARHNNSNRILTTRIPSVLMLPMTLDIPIMSWSTQAHDNFILALPYPNIYCVDTVLASTPQNPGLGRIVGRRLPNSETHYGSSLTFDWWWWWKSPFTGETHERFLLASWS